MSESFLGLPAKEQAEILKIYAPRIGKSALVAEKDIWVCWVLQQLFSMPGCLQMAFKGGTALSKVYGVIERFSEDIDVTLDYRGFCEVIPDNFSRSALERLSKQLRNFVADYSRNVIKPYLDACLEGQFPDRDFQVEISDDGELLRIYYPSVFVESHQQYLAANVLVEFGGRNITEPSEFHIVNPYVSDVPNIIFPEARVNVLALARSFWEKVTLVHVECNRKEMRSSVARMSRHWYDLARLSVHEKGKAAMLDRELLSDVIKYKKLFYNSSYANYDACLTSGFRLVPEKEMLSAMRRDFEAMLNSGMFFGEQPIFSEVIESVGELERRLNL